MNQVKQRNSHTGPGSAVKRALTHRRLRNLLIAWAISNAALWAWAVTIATIAFQIGGAPAVALALVARLVPGAIAAPFASVLATRSRDASGPIAITLFRIAAMLGATVVLVLDGPLTLLYAAAVVEGLGSGPMHALHTRLLPLTARMPDELAVANSFTELFRTTGILLGPTLAALLLLFADPYWVTLMCAVMLLITLPLLYWREPATGKFTKAPLVSYLAQLKEGALHTLMDNRTSILVGVFVLGGMVTGGIQVYITVVAIDIAGWGAPGPSILLSLVGLGGLLGGFLSLSLLDHKDLSVPLARGLFGIGLACMMLGASPSTVMIVLSTVLGGLALAIMVVTLNTLFLRGVALPQQAAVFGVSSLLQVVGIGAGGSVAAAFVRMVGIESALIATGTGLCALSVAVWALVRTVTAGIVSREREVQAVRQSKMFSMLAIGPLEQVSACLQRQVAAPGEVIIRQGEPGDDAYIVGSGRVSIVVDGKPIAELHDGEVFGELALLHDVPRTATVIAATPTELWKLNRDAFMFAVTGTPECYQMTTSVAKRRLEETTKLQR